VKRQEEVYSPSRTSLSPERTGTSSSVSGVGGGDGDAGVLSASDRSSLNSGSSDDLGRSSDGGVFAGCR
jgi:hypothetical protein